MSEITVFECNSCGNRFGAKNDVVPVPIRERVREWLPYREYTLHFCFDCRGSAASDLNNTQFKRFLVDENGEVAGYESGYRLVRPLSEFPQDPLDDPEALDTVVTAVESVLAES